MSDLVLGAASQGVTWVKGAERIVLAPVGQLDHTKAVSLYFQTMTRAEHQDVTTTIAIYAVAGAPPPVTLRGIAVPSAAPQLKVAFQWDVALGLSSFARELDVSRLTPGLYRFEVTLQTKAGEMLGKQSTQMRLR
jgi:hypothetical protein